MNQTEYVRHSGLSKGFVSKLVKRGMPLDSPEAADRWRGATARRPSRRTPPSPAAAVEAVHQQAQGAPPTPPTPGGPAAEALARAEQIERAAYALAIRSLREKAADAGKLVGIHATAAQNLIRTRQDVLAIEQQEGRLLTVEWIKKIIADHDGALVTLAKAMPRSLAGRIAPHDPEHAERELDRWVQEEFLKVLYRSNPWNTPKP